MKKDKSKLIIIVSIVVVFVVFIVLAIVFKDKIKDEPIEVEDTNEEYVDDVDEVYEEENKSAYDWQEDVKDGVVVTAVAASWCPHCQNLKPIMHKVYESYGFDLYWFEMDTLQKRSEEEYNIVLDTFDIENRGFDGYPYVFVVKDGEYVGYFSGERSESSLISELKDLGVEL